AANSTAPQELLLCLRWRWRGHVGGREDVGLGYESALPRLTYLPAHLRRQRDEYLLASQRNIQARVRLCGATLVDLLLARLDRANRERRRGSIFLGLRGDTKGLARRAVE